MKKWLKRLGLLLLLLVVSAAGFVWWQMRDRHKGYHLELDIPSTTHSGLRAGFAAVSITPKVEDTWTDANGDAQYNPKDGDTYQDNNGNGKFDPVWLAGFQNRRPAQGVNDELWARTMVLSDGTTRIAFVVLDVIGYFSDDIIAIRKALAEDLDIDYVTVSSTHTHEGPDLLGLWGKSHFKSGVDKVYRKYVIEQTVKSIEQAANNLQPAKLRFAQDLEGAKDLVEDSRKPIVLDHGLRLLQAIDLVADTTLGTLVVWANHPETTWNENLLISSDFPHYLREAMEKGIYYKDSLRYEGLGGICIFANGGIGGLMTTSPEFGVQSPFEDTVFIAPTFDKAKAQGEQIAILSLNTLADTNNVVTVINEPLWLKAKTIHLPLENNLHKLTAALGVFDRGFSGWMKVRSEICYWGVGPAAFLHQPGEIYPEILNGGIETPEGQDYAIADPIEIPPLRGEMKGTFRFTIGMSNDMIGYIIPKSQWDQKAPYTYGYEEDPYGEINSLGPNTAPILHKEIRQLLNEE